MLFEDIHSHLEWEELKCFLLPIKAHSLAEANVVLFIC